ncbi:heterokaryon incompatibility protein-domain-containing protein [Hyaloscypha sp. PMI_1271]|nr:heterokaryon incompatibility protein-domain-containing protein [Hyaloscypha sp. PMI_1271]
MAASESQSNSLPPYGYLPLPTTSSFRVLELLPGDPADDIHIRLHQAGWDKPPSYEAISYAWGDTNIKVQITCGDSTLEITPNLRDGLHQMRLRNRLRYLWANSICINQEDVSERGHQVSNMLEIYQTVTLVLVWLGLDKDGQAEEAFKVIKDIAEAACIQSSISFSDLRNIDDLWILITPEMVDLVSGKEHLFSSVYWFYTRPWFFRLWVYQEVNSGTEALVTCGNNCLSWEAVAFTATIFSTFPKELFSSSIHWSIVRQLSLRHAFNFPTTLRFRYSTGSQQVSIINFLNGCRRFSCSDPRDKIFALLGMPIFTDHSSVIKADYTKSKLEVYQQIVDLSLKQSQILNSCPLSSTSN